MSANRRVRTYEQHWQRFLDLTETHDAPARDRAGWRRWMLWPYIAFIIPVSDPHAVARLIEWQEALSPWLVYDPQPPNRLHITLHYVGLLRPAHWIVLPQTWQRSALTGLAQRVRKSVETIPAFDVQLGPPNAFPGVLFAEVHEDTACCLRTLRVKVRRALPLRARPLSPWPFLPHVTLGLWGRQPARPVVEALRPFRQTEPVTLHVDRLLFTIYTRSVVARRDLLAVAREDILAEYALEGHTQRGGV